MRKGIVEHPPQLETERLLLRALTLDDTDFIFQHFSDPVVTKQLLDEEPLTDRLQARELIEFFLESTGESYYRWGIVKKAEQVLVGTCGYHKWNKQQFRTEIGYDLSSTQWGQGIMREALQAMIGYLFNSPDLRRIEALVYVENHRSATLLERLGFQREGRLRDYFHLHGTFYDHFIYSLLKDEWDRFKS